MWVSYNWLQSFFKEPLPPVEELDELIALHAFETEGIEIVGNDKVIDIDVLPNRAHDCLSHIGIANDVRALLGREELVERYKHDKEYAKSDVDLKIDIQNTEKCRRYMGRVIENVTVGPTPEWVKTFLEAVGQRSINNVVDVTNFVMLDLGNPIHAFDLDKLDSPHIIVRDAKNDEHMTTLGRDQIPVDLDDSMLVIADESEPLALAGIKGGKKAEVDEGTTSIVLEIANFDPVSTRKTRQKTGIMTDSSKRFENELTPEIIPDVMDRLTKMILEVAGTENTKVGDIVDVYPEPFPQHTVSVTLDRVNLLLGVELGTSDVSDIFTRLQFPFTENDGEFTVQIPPQRMDLRIPEDLVEEIGRVYGYEKLPSLTVEDLPFEPQVNKRVEYQNRVSDILNANGFSEVMTYSFQKKGDIEVAKPVARDKGALRKNLSQGLGEALERNLYNAELFGDETVRLFEFGKTFAKGDESLHLAIAVGNKTKKAAKTAGNPKDQIAAVVEVLNTELGLSLEAPKNDDVYEINFDAVIEKLETPANYENLDVDLGEKTFKEFSTLPFIVRDIAVWVPEGVTPDELETMYRENGTELLQRVDQFDEFTKDGKTSYAHRMVFQSMEKSLTDDEIGEVMQGIEKVLTDKGWEIR